MQLLKGISVSPGYAAGTAVVFDVDVQSRLEIPRYSVPPSEIDTERLRLHEAARQAQRELTEAEQAARSQARNAKAADVLSVHSQLVSEVTLKVQEYIHQEQVNVEQALETMIGEMSQLLRELENNQIREREQDVRDVGQRMLRHLIGRPNWSEVPLPPETVVVAWELLPSETVELARSNLVAIVTQQGGHTSHTAILARSLGIPAVTGIPDVTAKIQAGQRLLVDGLSGEVTIDPTDSQWQRFDESRGEYARRSALATAVEEQPSVTRDGVAISLLANIARPDEVAQVQKHRLDGVGLFRTEFVFLESLVRPDIEAQVDIYRKVADELGDQPLTIRTFDLGGDKIPPFLQLHPHDPNPALALRGLRFSLAERATFNAQLRAIIEVARHRDVRVLFPMVIGRADFGQACQAVDAALRDAGATKRPLVGAMIETPASLFALDQILELADFLAIGTNDLTQYMLAVDRGSAELTQECTPRNPTVLRAIKRVVNAAQRHERPVCVCGEAAGDPGFACLLVGLGIRVLSMSPLRAANIRYAVRNIAYQDAKRLADQALACDTTEAVTELITHWLDSLTAES